MAERKLGDITFGTVLAFVAPGFIGLVALSYHLPVAKAWLDSAQQSEQSVGVFLFAALASIACGVIISGVRDLVADPLICSGWFGMVDTVTLPQTGYDNLRTPEVLAAFEAAVENYYRYYQFYANTAVALLLLAISRATTSTPPVLAEWLAMATRGDNRPTHPVGTRFDTAVRQSVNRNSRAS